MLVLDCIIELPVELMAELRAASINVLPRAFGFTLSALVARGVQSKLAKLRRDWNEGEPFGTGLPCGGTADSSQSPLPPK